MSRLSLAKDIMWTEPVTVAPDDDVLQGIELLLRQRVTGGPVLGKDRQYLGTLAEKGCLSVLLERAREAGHAGQTAPPARDFMARNLLTLRPETDAIDAISTLLKHGFSGAPVVDAEGRFLGVFSEHYMMRLLINSAYEQVPSTRVDAFMSTAPGRLIEEDTGVFEIVQAFLDSHYRRLVVLRDGKLVGQVSHRDVFTTLIDSHRGSIPADTAPGDSEPRSSQIFDFMDTATETIGENLDLWSIAQIFLSSVRIRLPVLRDGKLVGQVVRRDLLASVLDLLSKQPDHKQPGLFLSAIMQPDENPLLR
jgi:CBS domain-containing protein